MDSQVRDACQRCGQLVCHFAASRDAGFSKRWNAYLVARSCLLVDDNPTFVDAARKLLRRQGLDVAAVATDNETAVAAVRAFSPDIALVDVDLGEESGLDVARELVKVDKRLAVILISAYDQTDLEDVIAGSDALGFLSKSLLSRAAIDELLGAASEPEAT